jgi:type VI protein secretion system component VasK
MTLVIEVPELSVGWWWAIGIGVSYLVAAVVVRLCNFDADGDELPPPIIVWLLWPFFLLIFGAFGINCLLAGKKPTQSLPTKPK